MVKLKELDLKTVRPDADETVDCICKNPIGPLEKLYIHKDNQIYLICPQCGEIYKVKD